MLVMCSASLPSSVESVAAPPLSLYMPQPDVPLEKVELLMRLSAASTDTGDTAGSADVSSTPDKMAASNLVIRFFFMVLKSRNLEQSFGFPYTSLQILNGKKLHKQCDSRFGIGTTNSGRI